MRIIRTGRIITDPTSQSAQVAKGWVREGVLSSLAVEPSTLTEVSRRLGVSKSTASYHLSQLMARGAVEIVGSRKGKGGVVMKRYGLKQGSLVTLMTTKDEEAELARLRETFDLQVLSWESSAGTVDLGKVQSLLYRMFLHMFKIARSEHRALMLEYGRRAGAAIASRAPAVVSKEVPRWTTEYLDDRGLADTDLLELPDSPVSVIISSACIGSTSHQNNSCYFLEGIVEGIVRAKMGPNVKVGRVAVPGVSSCMIAVGRVKKLDPGWVADAVLTSPGHSLLSHGGRRE